MCLPMMSTVMSTASVCLSAELLVNGCKSPGNGVYRNRGHGRSRSPNKRLYVMTLMRTTLGINKWGDRKN